MDQQKAILLRTKKLGVLLREARKIAGQSAAVCAQAIGVPVERYEAYELGEETPSLPEIEALAYFLNVPLAHFWNGARLSSYQQSRLEKLDRAMALRQRLIGALIRKFRQEAGLSSDALAEQVDVPAETLERYELGETPVPLPLLELIAEACNHSVRDFYDRKGPFGVWMSQQESIQRFLELPPALQNFVAQPINRPYLELAQRLSEMEVNKLRAIAEGLLEITL